MIQWRFRQGFSPLPGVRLTLSPSGISTSVGSGPFRLTAGRRGLAATVGIPGTGLSFRVPLSPLARALAGHGEAPSPPPTAAAAPAMQEVASAGSSVLTTPGLSEFKRLLEQAHREHGAITRELPQVRQNERGAVDKFERWKNGWLFRRLFKQTFADLAVAAEEATARRVELEEQESLSRLQTQFDMPADVEKAFHRLRDEFALLSKADRIWDTVATRATNRAIERTEATATVERKPVSFALSNCEIIESDWTVPRLANANGGDLFLFPGFVLYFVSKEAYALLEYAQVTMHCGALRFHETEPLPTDAAVVGQTWAKANKDGSRDQRFAANFQIPVVRYAQLTFTSTTGLNEVYLISNVAQASAFDDAWRALVASGVAATGGT